jgi:hypothetical protein
MKIVLSILTLFIIVTNTCYSEINNSGIEEENKDTTNKKCISEKNCNTSIQNINLKCSSNYSPICGIKDWEEKTYKNSCYLEKEKARYKYAWTCWNKIKSTSSNIWEKNKKLVKKIEDSKTWNNEPFLDSKLKVKVNKSINKLKISLYNKKLTIYQKKNIINNINLKLDKVKKAKPQLSDLIDYIIFKLREI